MRTRLVRPELHEAAVGEVREMVGLVAATHRHQARYGPPTPVADGDDPATHHRPQVRAEARPELTHADDSFDGFHVVTIAEVW